MEEGKSCDDRASQPKDTGKQAELAFKLYDKDKDGYITKSEMEKLSKNLTKEQIEKVFARFDADGDGRLSYAEFRKMMNKWKQDNQFKRKEEICRKVFTNNYEWNFAVQIWILLGKEITKMEIVMLVQSRFSLHSVFLEICMTILKDRKKNM